MKDLKFTYTTTITTEDIEIIATANGYTEKSGQTKTEYVNNILIKSIEDMLVHSLTGSVEQDIALHAKVTRENAITAAMVKVAEGKTKK